MQTEPFYSAILLFNDADRNGMATTEVVRHLSKEQYEHFNEAYQEINQILNLNVFTYFKSTVLGYGQALQADMDEFKNGKIRAGQPDDIVRIGVRMRSAVLSLCSALHFHQEHTYRKVVELHGEDSRAHGKIRTIFNRMFEKSPEYRLLYHTRNTMVHCTMDTIKISASIRLIDGERQSISNPTIDISAITELNKEIPGNYRRELESMEEDPSVTELVTKLYPVFEDANNRIMMRLYPNAEAACQTIREFDALFGDRQGLRGMTTEKSTNPPPPLRYSQQMWATNVLDYARARA